MPNGAQVIANALAAGGIDVCFANPGTSEMHIVDALSHSGIRLVLGLFENVCTGAADGYARMTGRPALSLLHLGPGLANGLANLHNARRGGVPTITLVGNHARPLQSLDPPLSTDIAAIARGIGARYVVLDNAREHAARVAAGLADAVRDPSRPVIFDLPADAAWESAAIDGPVVTMHDRFEPNAESVAALANTLRTAGPRGALAVNLQSLDDAGLARLERISATWGTRLFAETFAARHARGAGRILVERLMYFPKDVLMQLADVDLLVLAGARRPTAFFAYPGAPLDLVPAHCTVQALTEGQVGAAETVEALSAYASDGRIAVVPHQTALPEDGPLDPISTARTIAHLLGDDTILIDEAITISPSLYAATATARRHDLLSLPGGALGYSLPAAIGAAIAAPDRAVVCVVGDGSAHYAVQALWTMAREALPITVVVLANRAYRILEMEFAAMTGTTPTGTAHGVMQLAEPAPDWQSLAAGYGLLSTTVTTTAELAAAVARSQANHTPSLICAQIL